MKSEKEHYEEHYCDFCHKQLGYADYTDVKLPALYFKANVLNGPEIAEDETGLKAILNSLKGEGELVFNTYDVCRSCVDKIVTLQVIPAPKKICENYIEVFGGRKTILKQNVRDLTFESLKAYYDSLEEKCLSCKYRSDDICIIGNQTLEKSFNFFESYGRCKKWAFDDKMGTDLIKDDPDGYFDYTKQYRERALNHGKDTDEERNHSTSFRTY